MKDYKSCGPRSVISSTSVTPRASNNTQASGSNNKGKEATRNSISKSPKR